MVPGLLALGLPVLGGTGGRIKPLWDSQSYHGVTTPCGQTKPAGDRATHGEAAHLPAPPRLRKTLCSRNSSDPELPLMGMVWPVCKEHGVREGGYGSEPRVLRDCDTGDSPTPQPFPFPPSVPT